MYILRCKQQLVENCAQRYRTVGNFHEYQYEDEICLNKDREKCLSKGCFVSCIIKDKLMNNTRESAIVIQNGHLYPVVHQDEKEYESTESQIFISLFSNDYPPIIA